MNHILILEGEVSKTLNTSIEALITKSLTCRAVATSNKVDFKFELQRVLFNLIILDIDIIDTSTIGLVRFARNQGVQCPILILTSELKESLHGKMNALPDVHLLVKPFHEKNIVGISEKLLKTKKVPKQLYRRFYTNQMAHLESLESGSSLLTSMYNLSRGGGYCEFEAVERVAIGEFLRVKVNLNDSDREYTLNAKVVWTVPKGRFSGRFGVGFKFVKPEDAYRSLISKM